MSAGLGVDRNRTFRQASFTLVARLVVVAVMEVVEEVRVLRNGQLA